jgi:hypothetical protein
MGADMSAPKWTVFEHSLSDVSVYDEESGEAICWLDTDESTEASQDQDAAKMLANAKLIAAAPDLLEALQEVVPIIEHLLMIRGDPQPGSIGHKAREAISKATGESV